MAIINRYFRQGTPDVDAASPEAPTQGLTITQWAFDDVASEWVHMQRDSAGNPVFGYLAQELDKATADLWLSRINGAARSINGYQDSEGVWYPGSIGVGISVVSQSGRDAQLSRLQEIMVARAARAKELQSVTPRQARQWLIANDLDEALEAAIISIGASGSPEDVKQSKLAWAWYEMAESWVYGHATLKAALDLIGVDRDKFFAEAKLL